MGGVSGILGDVSLTRGNTPTTPSTPLTPTTNTSDNSVFAPVLIGGLVTPSSCGSFSLSPGPPPPPYPAPTRPLSPLPPPLPPRRKRESSVGDTSPKVKQAPDAPMLPPRDSSPPPPLPPRREAGSTAPNLPTLPRAHSVAALSSRPVPFPVPTSPHIPPRPHQHHPPPTPQQQPAPPQATQQQQAHNSSETWQNHSAFRFPPAPPPSYSPANETVAAGMPPLSRRHSAMDVGHVSPVAQSVPLSPSPFHHVPTAESSPARSTSVVAPSLHPPLVPRRFSALNGGPPLHSPPLLPQTTEPRSPAQYR